MAQQTHPRVRFVVALWLWVLGPPASALAGEADPAPALEQLEPARALPLMIAPGRLPNRSGVQALQAALDKGLQDEVADAALAALGEQGGKEAQATLLEFTAHRRHTARMAAYRALANGFPANVSREVLERGLGDGDPQVRNLCAELLGRCGDARSLPRLFQALDHDVKAAAPAIGTLADGPDLVEFATRLRTVPLPVMLSGYEAALLRKTLPASAKVALVTQLQEQGTPAVRQFLQRMLIRVDWSAQPEVRKALAQTIQRLPASAAQVKQP